MSDATLFATQWVGLVAQVRLFGAHAPDATLIERDGMVASVMPGAPTSSLMNVTLAVDQTDAPASLRRLAEQFRQGGARKWGLGVDAGDDDDAEPACGQGMALDGRPAGMVADLETLPFHDAAASTDVDLATVGRVNDLAHCFPEPKLAPPVTALYERLGFVAVGSLHPYEEQLV